MPIIKPSGVSGTRDYLPAEAIARQGIVDTIRRVYGLFGFVPIETPAIERLDVLTGNSPDFDTRLFRTSVVQGLGDLEVESSLALRFDLTVPLARVVAAYPDIPKPFKRYQVGSVWRGETPQHGRYREFMQFDADIIGSRSILADAEIIHMMHEVMKALGFERFVIQINSRKILNGLLSKFPDLTSSQRIEVLRILDNKALPSERALKALMREAENEHDQSAPALSQEQSKEILAFVAIKDGDILAQAEAIIGETELGREGITELRAISANLNALDIPSENWIIDLSIARGLGYYTGPVFETVLLDLPEIGSVYSGGRFDGLADRFIRGSNIPGVGTSVGVDRLFAAKETLGLVESKLSNTQVLILLFDPSITTEYLQLAVVLRAAGISTEVYLDEKPFGAQLGYAAKLSIPWVVIIGPDEKQAGKVSIKNMETREQQTVDKNQLVAIIRGQ